METPTKITIDGIEYVRVEPPEPKYETYQQTFMVKVSSVKNGNWYPFDRSMIADALADGLKRRADVYGAEAENLSVSSRPQYGFGDHQ